MVTIKPLEQAIKKCDYCEQTTVGMRYGTVNECWVCGHDFCPDHYGCNFNPSEPRDDRSLPMDWGIDPGVMICCVCMKETYTIESLEGRKAKLIDVRRIRSESGKWPWPVYDWPKPDSV
jgi:hypothetical protein